MEPRIKTSYNARDASPRGRQADESGASKMTRRTGGYSRKSGVLRKAYTRCFFAQSFKMSSRKRAPELSKPIRTQDAWCRLTDRHSGPRITSVRREPVRRKKVRTLRDRELAQRRQGRCRRWRIPGRDAKRPRKGRRAVPPLLPRTSLAAEGLPATRACAAPRRRR